LVGPVHDRSLPPNGRKWTENELRNNQRWRGNESLPIHEIDDISTDTLRDVATKFANTAERQEWLRLLACADSAVLAEIVDPVDSAHRDQLIELRQPEVGLALITGRVGATGDPFGLGEMTLTRCVVQLGEYLGVGYVRGRAPRNARQIAVIDALLQSEHHDEVHRAVVVPLMEQETKRRREASARTEATRVQFLTMVRGN
jgi:alpha-D-ribose 1-methylphosphonate 5-triphosphate synthase subunit PhnG